MASELRTRAVLAPTMLLLIGGIYWYDTTGAPDWYGADGGFQRRVGALSAVVFALLGIAGVHEYLTMMRKAGFAVSKNLLLTITAALLASPFFFGWHQIDHELYPMVASTLLLAFPLALKSLRRDDMQKGLERQGATLLGFIFVAWPMFLAMGTCLRHLPSALYVVLVCKGGDIGGYCVGRLLGRTKLIPHISPGKTVEGALGSLAASVLLAVLLRGPLLGDELGMSVGIALLVGALLNFTTQTGDLIESLLKRRCGAKDSSALLPAHGGVLDLIDSLLFSFCAWFPVLVMLT